MDQIFHCRGR